MQFTPVLLSLRSHRLHFYRFRFLLPGAMALCLISCSRTGAQNEAPAPQTVAALPAAPARLAGSAGRALWVWDARTIIDPALGQSLLAFCGRQKIDTIFLSTGSAFVENPERSRVQVPLTTMATFLEKAHAAGLAVHNLDGDPEFALKANHARTLARLQRVLDYNAKAAANARVDGYQWDTEPYTLKEWKASEAAQPGILQQYLDSAQQMVDAVKTAGGQFSLGYAIPAWWDNPQRALDWNGSNKAPAYHLLDVLNQVPGSYIALMSYRDKAVGSNSTVSISQDEINYAAQHAPAVKVWVGQETLDLKDEPNLTFYQEGAAALETAVGQIDESFKSQPVFAGVAIHHWVSYADLIGRSLITIDAPVADAATGHETPVSGTVKTPQAGQKIQISVKPNGDIWYDQQEVAVGADGAWNATARIGNDKTAPGTRFAIRAALKAADGSTVAERMVYVKFQP